MPERGSRFRRLFGCGVSKGVFPNTDQSAARQRRAAAEGFERRLVHAEPRRGVHRQRVEHGIERRVAVLRGAAVPGAEALARVATEDPAVEVRLTGLFPLDGAARDAAARVDGPVRGDGSRGAVVDAAAAGSAARPFERRVVAVGLFGENQLAQHDVAPVLRRDEQRLPADPPQPGLYGQLLFGQRRGVDEGAASQTGVRRAQGVEHPAEHRPEGGVVIRRAGVGGHLRPVPGRIALADAVFVRHGADHGRACAFDQPARVEAFVDVTFQIAQRRLAAAGQPCAEQRLVFGQMAARGDAAEVEPCAGGEPFDVQMVDHRDN